MLVGIDGGDGSVQPLRTVVGWIVQSGFGYAAPILRLLGYNWTVLTGWQVGRDLRDYSQAIRHSDRRAECGIAEKERLLDQVEKIDDDLRRGKCIGWLRWRETDQVIRDLLQGGINSKKARLMVREFRRLEKELNQ